MPSSALLNVIDDDLSQAKRLLSIERIFKNISIISHLKMHSQVQRKQYKHPQNSLRTYNLHETDYEENTKVGFIVSITLRESFNLFVL